MVRANINKVCHKISETVSKSGTQRCRVWWLSSIILIYSAVILDNPRMRSPWHEGSEWRVRRSDVIPQQTGSSLWKWKKEGKMEP